MNKKAEADCVVVREILSYFLRNPKAADDLEGIVRFRLLEERVHRQTERTRLALRWLVSEGFLQESRPPGRDAIFGLNEGRSEDARRFIGIGTLQENSSSRKKL